jgi:hypothetical protein
VQLSGQPPETEAEAEADAPEDEATVDSAEYAAVVEAYTNKKGELSYDLINKDFIQFAPLQQGCGELVGQPRLRG